MSRELLKLHVHNIERTVIEFRNKHHDQEQADLFAMSQPDDANNDELLAAYEADGSAEAAAEQQTSD